MKEGIRYLVDQLYKLNSLEVQIDEENETRRYIQAPNQSTIINLSSSLYYIYIYIC